MHYRLEVIMPPTDNVEAALKEIMEPFSENNEEANDAFWDYYIVGGRYSGNKLMDMLDPDIFQAFEDELQTMKIMQKGLVWGKPEHVSQEQCEKVDALWCKMFPDSPIIRCPMFKNGSGIDDETQFGDVMKWGDIDVSKVSAYHIIFAGPSYDNSTLEARKMWLKSAWNGVSIQDTEWDGCLGSMWEDYKQKLENYKPDYAANRTPTDDWLVVTVDYHS